jgi:multidrug efflux pump subunit AcrA (membrane-fusion protein)
MKARKFIVFIILLIIIGLFMLVGSISYQSGVSYGESHAEEIRSSLIKDVNATKTEKFANIQMALNENQPVKVSGSGRVTPGTIINISTEVQGVLIGSIKLKKGTSFSKGDLLFQIKDVDAKLMLAARKSSYLSLWTSVLPDLATDHSEQYDKWYSFFNSIAVDQPLSKFPSFSSAREKNFIISRNLLAEYLNIKSDEYRLTKYQQIAPFNGSIVEAYSDQGAIVNPGSPVIQVMRNDELEIEIPVPVKYMQKIKVGSKVSLFENGVGFEGKVLRKGDFINSNTQSVPVYVKPSSKHPLYYGMYVQADMEFEDVVLVSRIPRKAVFGKNKIYRFNNDSTIQAIEINIRSSDDKAYYVDNLKDSIFYVAQPLLNAKDSIKLTPVFQ